MRTVSVLIAASIVVSGFALAVEKKNESLGEFRSVSANAIKKCQEQNGDGLKKIEDEIHVHNYKANLDSQLLSRSRQLGLQSDVARLEAEREKFFSDFLVKRDAMTKELFDSADACAKS